MAILIPKGPTGLEDFQAGERRGVGCGEPGARRALNPTARIDSVYREDARHDEERQVHAHAKSEEEGCDLTVKHGCGGGGGVAGCGGWCGICGVRRGGGRKGACQSFVFAGAGMALDPRGPGGEGGQAHQSGVIAVTSVRERQSGSRSESPAALARMHRDRSIVVKAYFSDDLHRAQNTQKGE